MICHAALTSVDKRRFSRLARSTSATHCCRSAGDSPRTTASTTRSASPPGCWRAVGCASIGGGSSRTGQPMLKPAKIAKPTVRHRRRGWRRDNNVIRCFSAQTENWYIRCFLVTGTLGHCQFDHSPLTLTPQTATMGYLLFLIPPFLLSLYAQWRVKSAFSEMSQVPATMTGAAAARRMLDSAGLHAIPIERVRSEEHTSE